MTIVAEVTSELVEWSKELMPWQRMILTRLLSNEDISETEGSQIFKRAKIDYGFETTDHPLDNVALDPIDTASSGSVQSIIRLVAMKNLEGANALRTGQALKFGKELTVVYGENGSGKSGYARVLKKACSSKSVEIILPNVYSKSSPREASCTFEIERDGQTDSIEWTGEGRSVEDLKQFAVCDSKCASIYIGSANQLQFAPAIFDVFEVLASATEAMKQRFSQLGETLAPRPDALSHLIDRTSIGDMLSELSHSSDLDEIRRKARWGQMDDKVLTEKQAELQRLKSQSPEQAKQNLIAEKKRLELIRDNLKRVEDAIAESKIVEIRSKLGEHKSHDKAAKTAAQLALGNAHLEGVGDEAWRQLLLAASRYSTQDAYPSSEFPFTGTDARCVLCQQSLDDEAKQRLESFWSFLNSEASAKRDRAKREIDQMITDLNALPLSVPPEIAAIEDALLPENRSRVAEGKHYFESAAKYIAAIQAAIQLGRIEALPALPMSLLAGCNGAIEKVIRDISALEKESGIAQTITSMETDVSELTARRRLSQNMQLVINYVEALKQSGKASSIAGEIRTNSISIKSREMQTKHLTETYESAVRANIKSLGVRSAKAVLSGKSTKGKVLHSVTLEGAATSAKPGAILSEGERNGVSLACFLAELGTADETPGIILDDPVTSLDHRIRERVVKRLVEEAKQRQVIVFTHDLVFYCQLLAEAELRQVNAFQQHIESLPSIVGLISDSEPWDALDVGKRIVTLESLIKEVKGAETAGDSEEYRSKVVRFYSRLRSTWERCIEELVFNKVVERYDKAVKALRLTEVSIDTEAIAAILMGWGRASGFIEAHDHAVGENKPLPTEDELSEDLNALKDFMAEQKKRKKQAGEMHKHLKG